MARAKSPSARSDVLDLSPDARESIRLYYFTGKRWGLKALWEKRLKISTHAEANDPFEFAAFDRSDTRDRARIDKRMDKLRARDEGRLCFSDRWRTMQLWTQYAEKHAGLCLGFDLYRDDVVPIRYLDGLDALPVDKLAAREALRDGLHRKPAAWSHEREWQRAVALGAPHDGLHFRRFGDDLHLREVIIGARCPLAPADIVEAVTRPPLDVEIFKARPAHDAWEVCRHELVATHTTKGYREALRGSRDLYHHEFERDGSDHGPSM